MENTITFLHLINTQNAKTNRINRMSQHTEEEDHYDYLVIGGGSGGIASAKRAASLYKAKVGGE